ncbi:hypothetical protein L3X38_019398 [Prunus dulcis]|uniref:Uncharacterized protein n=1 Tax=Prunus dulcis TaxID=3755 RepID=A0AAD4WB33_PRUDU|nr:hypothetical protein L3X38_019398 [Prunus dulcis]
MGTMDSEHGDQLLETSGVTILALFNNKPDLLEWVTLMILLGLPDGTRDPFGKCNKCLKFSAVRFGDAAMYELKRTTNPWEDLILMSAMAACRSVSLICFASLDSPTANGRKMKNQMAIEYNFGCNSLSCSCTGMV